MDELLYQMIFKRKSFHIFKGEQHLTEEELEEIEEQMAAFTPLVNGIQTAWRIVPKHETTCKRGEYCILAYSEKKDGYLYNIGYLFEQLDLWLASRNIGVCWYGMGKTEEPKYQGLDFVILITIEKANEKDFRKDYTKAKRKDLVDIWQGDMFQEIATVVRFTPSACNTQPWLVEVENNIFNIYRVKGKRGVMPADKVSYYNKIDIGIFLLFMELCFKHEKITYERKIISDIDDKDKNLVASYYINAG
jgi:hypothetical protein